MLQKKYNILITGIMLACSILYAGSALAQDTTAKTYICYFYTTDGAQDYEVTFSPGGYLTVNNTNGNGLYLSLGIPFVGYFLILDTFIWKSTRTVAALDSDDWLDKHDIFMLFTGFATGTTIEGTGVRLIDKKNPRAFFFFGYQNSAQ